MSTIDMVDSGGALFYIHGCRFLRYQRLHSSAGSTLVSSSPARGLTERLWQDYFADPSQWWDNRKNKTDPNAADFKHKTTDEPLWIHGSYNPNWVKDMLGKEEAARTNNALFAKKDLKNVYICNSNPSSDLFKVKSNAFAVENSISGLDTAGKQHSIENIVCILHKCRKTKNLDSAKHAHAQICDAGLEVHKNAGNHIVPMLVECRGVFVAQQAFNILLHRNEHSWTSLISGYIECGQSQHALNLYQKMQYDGADPSSYTFTTLLRACARAKDLESGRKIHLEIKQKRLEEDIFVCNTLVDMYAKCGSVLEAREVFDKLLIQDVVSWNALITGYAENGLEIEALNCLKQMEASNVSPDAVTYVCSLKACGNVRAIDKGREIHHDISRSGLDKDVSVGNALVGMYARCSSLLEAREVFDTLPIRQVASWTTLIAAYIGNGSGQEALKCFEQMQVEGVSPDAVMFACILKACGSIGAVDKAQEILTRIAEKGYEKDLSVGNALVDMYAKCGLPAKARDVLDKMPVRDVVSWTAMIAGYVENELGVEALRCFEQMQQDNLSPNAATFICLLKACASIEDGDRGREIHSLISQRGFEKDLYVGNTLVGMYVKCGLLTEAQKAFNNLPVRDIVSWNTLIAGYAEQGQGHEVLNCLRQMQAENTPLSAATFVSILKSCGIMKDLDNGRKVHRELMQNGFGNDSYVGNSLVDMYAKCGSILEARVVFENLPLQDVVSWTTLISGYVEHGLGEEALKCFDLMHQAGMPPDCVTYVCILKACGIIGALKKGREIHTGITKEGFKQDTFIGNTLIDMYAKCGSLLEACNVFDTLPSRDVVSWNALISGFSENGNGMEALKCFEQMQLERDPPNIVTFVCALKACRSLGAIEQGRGIHREIVQRGCETDLIVSNTLMDMYAKCGSITDAQVIFNKLPHRDVVSWTTLISGYTENGLSEEALKWFEQMQQEGPAPHAMTFVCCLKACGNRGAIEKGREIHSLISQIGLEGDPFLGNSLIDMYAKCASLTEAQEVFDKLPSQDIVSWNTLIAGYAENDIGEKGLKYFKQMQLKGISPDASTFLCSLKCCSIMRALDEGREIHNKIVQNGLERDLFIGTSLVDMYAKCGSLSEARHIFDKLPVRNVVTWNALGLAYCENGLSNEALECFSKMRLEGVTPNIGSYIFGLKACGSVKAIEKGLELHREIVEEGFEGDPFIGSTLVDMYAKCGLLIEAQKVFDELEVRDVVSWTALIAGYTENGFGEEALKYFEQMEQQGVCLDTATFICSLKACGSIGAIEKGRKIHIKIRQKGLEQDLFISSILVDMYAKCGSLEEAREVFNELAERDAVLWNAMIRGYGMNHEGVMAVQCFEDMQKDGIKPDATTFICLLAACSRAGLVLKGQEYLRVMKEKFGILPTTDHYSCMIDLLARSSKLYEAKELLKSTECRPSKDTLIALLSACKTYGEAELGQRCFQQLVQLDPENARSYVLISNIYANLGRQDDANRIEELRKQAGVMKKPARALIEVNNEVHEFVVNNEQSEEISAMLGKLNSRLKEYGYVPNIDLVLKNISDEEKEVALCGHAEKMAIAFGLLHTPQGQTLRMTKNLRMCVDCHNASKIISRAEGREIVLRESNWIHHFKDGLCSCGDMW